MVIIDALLKIVIDTFFMEYRFYINEGLGFTPFLNKEQLSFFNNEWNGNVSLFTLILLNVGAIILLAIFLNKMREDREWTRALDISVIFVLAGAVCSLTDKIFWGGSLDYILIYSQIADLKDIYLLVGVVIYFAEMFRQIFRRLFLTYI